MKFRIQLYMFFLSVFAELAGNGGSSGLFSDELNSKIAEQKVRLEPHELIIRKDITGAASDYPLLERSTDYVKGVITLQNQSFPSNEAFIAERARIGYTNAAADANPGSLSYDGTIPAALRNATLIGMQDGREVLNIAVSTLVAKGTATGPTEYWAEFSSPRVFVDQKKIELKLQMPQDVALSAKTSGDPNHYFEFIAQGVITRNK